MSNDFPCIEIQYNADIIGSVVVMIVCNIAYPNRIWLVDLEFLLQDIFFSLLVHQIKSLGTVSHTEHIVFVHNACDHSFCDLMTTILHNGCDLSGTVYLPTFVIYFSYDRQKFFSPLSIFCFSILSTQFSVVIRCFRYLQSFAEKIDRIFF